MLEASMKDLQPYINGMIIEKKNLKIAMDTEDIPDEQLAIVVDHMTRIVANYDDQVKLAKRSLPKAKATTTTTKKAKAKAAPAT